MNVRIWSMVLAVFLAACSGGEGKGDAWKFQSDAGRDADHSGDAGGGEDAGSPGAVTFRLVNGGTLPVFAYPSVAGYSCGGGPWLEVLEGGTSYRLQSDCTRCACSEDECLICAVDCLPGVSADRGQISAGGARVFEWDGLLRVDDMRPTGGVCESLRPPMAQTLTARFCWAGGFEPTFEGFGDLVDITCEEVEFSVDDAVVEFTIPPVPAPAPLRFELANGTAEMRYAHISTGGGCDTGQWLTVSRDGVPLRIVDACGTCSCTETNDPNMCPQPCPAVACAPPSRELFELPPGALRVADWNRVAYFDDTVDGAMCDWDRFVTGSLSARFCWGTDVDDGFTLVNEQCADIAFDASDDTPIRHLITE